MPPPHSAHVAEWPRLFNHTFIVVCCLEATNADLLASEYSHVNILLQSYWELSLQSKDYLLQVHQ